MATVGHSHLWMGMGLLVLTCRGWAWFMKGWLRRHRCSPRTPPLPVPDPRPSRYLPAALWWAGRWHTVVQTYQSPMASASAAKASFTSACTANKRRTITFGSDPTLSKGRLANTLLPSRRNVVYVLASVAAAQNASAAPKAEWSSDSSHRHRRMSELSLEPDDVRLLAAERLRPHPQGLHERNPVGLDG